MRRILRAAWVALATGLLLGALQFGARQPVAYADDSIPAPTPTSSAPDPDGTGGGGHVGS